MWHILRRGAVLPAADGGWARSGDKEIGRRALRKRGWEDRAEQVSVRVRPLSRGCRAPSLRDTCVREPGACPARRWPAGGCHTGASHLPERGRQAAGLPAGGGRGHTGLVRNRGGKRSPLSGAVSSSCWNFLPAVCAAVLTNGRHVCDGRSVRRLVG